MELMLKLSLEFPSKNEKIKVGIKLSQLKYGDDRSSSENEIIINLII